MAAVITHSVSAGGVVDSTAAVDGAAWDAQHVITGVMTPAQGGTGVINNDASTITISGSFGATFTLSATTSVTFPTTGTLATLAGSEALTNKTYNGNTWTAGTGVLTIAAAKTLTANNTLTFTGTDASSVAFGAGGTVAYTGSTLAQFAATTSAQLAGVISDETGTGALVFANSPALVTPTGIVKGDVGLGNVDNTSDADKPVSTATQTALDAKADEAITVTAGAGLTGGGDLSANRTVAVGAGSGIAVNADDVALDINSLAADASPDGATDYVVTWDASATAHKKVLLDNLPGGGGGSADFFDTVADALAADASQDVFYTRGNLAVDDGGGATYLQVAADPTEEGSFLLTNGNWAKLHQPVVTPQMFLASGDAGDAGLMLQRFVTYVTTDGTIGVVPRGSYAISTGVTITAPSDRRVSLYADGALFTTSGAIWGFTVTGGGYSGGVDLHNFSFNQQDDANALGGIRLIGAGSNRIIKPIIEGGQTTNTGYTGVYVAQSDTADPDTGSFWNTIQDCQIFSTTVDEVPFGILLQGAANATRVIGGQIGTATRGVSLYGEGASGNYTANGVVIDGVSFESGTYGVYFNGVSGDIDSRVLGLRIVNNRFESVGTAIIFNNCDQVSEDPPVIANNMFLGVTNRVVNNGNINILGDEAWIPYTPTVTASAGTITTSAINGARYKQQGKIVTFSVKITITTNGTGSGFLKFTLPLASHASNPGAAFAAASTGAVALAALIGAGATSDVFVATVAGAYPASDGFAFYCTGSYERA